MAIISVLKMLIILFYVNCITDYSSAANLDPAKISESGIYRLEIQSEDKFLTAGEAGKSNEITATRNRWTGSPEQKWKLVLSNHGQGQGQNSQAWTLSSLSGNAGIQGAWKIAYVGHGKFRLTNVANGLCLAGSGSSTVGERKCEKDTPYQRWLVQDLSQTKIHS